MKKVTKFGLEVLTGKAFCLFDLNLSIKPVKKFFVYKCKFTLLVLLKTTYNNLFYRMILNRKRIHNSF